MINRKKIILVASLLILAVIAVFAANQLKKDKAMQAIDNSLKIFNGSVDQATTDSQTGNMVISVRPKTIDGKIQPAFAVNLTKTDKLYALKFGAQQTYSKTPITDTTLLKKGQVVQILYHGDIQNKPTLEEFDVYQ